MSDSKHNPEADALSLERLASLSTDDALALLHAGGRAESTLVAAAAEAEQLIMRELPRGLALIPTMIGLADAARLSLPRMRFRRVWAQALCYANRMEEALVSLAEATHIADAAADGLERARIKTTSLHALARLGRYADAIAAGEEACAAFEQHGEHEMVGRTNNNLGVVRRMSDDPAGALKHFERAALFVTANPMLAAQLNSNRAEAYLDLGRLAEAEQSFIQARDGFTRAQMENGAAIVEGNLADLAARQGKPHLALQRFERALRALESASASGDAARLEAEQAEVLSLIGLHTSSERSLRRVVPVLQQSGLRWEHARALAALGRAEMAIGQLDEAQATLAHAKDAFDALTHATGAARATLARAESMLLAGDAAGAMRAADDAADAMRGRPVDRARALLVSGVAMTAAGELSAAEQVLSDVVQTATSLDIAPLLAAALHARGRVRAQRRDPAAAATDLVAAVHAAERVRGMLQAERFRTAALGEHARVYEDAASALLDSNPADPAPALDIIERVKARSTLELMSGAAEEVSPDQADARVLADVESKRAALNAVYSTLDDGFAKPRASSHATANWSERISTAERELEDVERRLAASGRFSGAFAAPVSLDAVRATLDEGTVLIEYFAEQRNRVSTLSAIVISSSGAAIRRDLCEAGALADAAAAWRFQLSRALARGPAACNTRVTQGADERLEALGHLVLAPLERDIRDARQVIIVPHGLLWSLPMHALRLNATPLLARSAVSITPSASIAARLRDVAAPPNAHAVCFGVSDEHAPRTEQEAAAIAARIPGAICKLGAAARCDALRQSIHGAGLLHVAAHARFVPAAPQASGLRLADGWLTAADVLRMRLAGAGVVLSACDSGRSGVDASNDLLGLIRAFLVAGARGVVSSLWPLHDETALKIMVESVGLGYAASGFSGVIDRVRDAQIEQAKAGVHPAFWAPLFTIGVGRKAVGS